MTTDDAFPVLAATMKMKIKSVTKSLINHQPHETVSTFLAFAGKHPTEKHLV